MEREFFYQVTITNQQMLARSWKQDFFGYIHYWKRILSSYGYHNKSMDVWENFLETGFFLDILKKDFMELW